MTLPRLLPVLAAVALVVTGCGGADHSGSEAAVVHPGAGVNSRVGNVLLRDVSIDEPRDATFAPGQVVRLRVTLFNEGDTPDAFLGVTTPIASDTRLVRDANCDGTAEVVSELPLPGQDPVRTPAPGVPNGPEVAYVVQLVLQQAVPSGQSVPVTFAFRQAGTTTVQVPVEVPDAPGTRDDPGCEPVVPSQG